MERQEREEKTCVEGTKKVGTEMQHPAYTWTALQMLHMLD